MIVDPATGEMIEEGRNPAPKSMMGTYGTAVGQNAGIETPLFYDMMEMIPSGSTTVAWNMRRVQNTIFRNRTSSSKAGGLRQTFSPFRFGSLADVGNIDPQAAGLTRGFTNKPLRKRTVPTGPPSRWNIPDHPMGIPTSARLSSAPGPAPGFISDMGRKPRAGYTPFQLSGMGNRMYDSKFARSYLGAKELSDGQRAFAPGTLGTLAAGSSLMAGGGAVSASRANNVIGATARFAGEGANLTGLRQAVATGVRPGGAALNRGAALTGALQGARFQNSMVTGKIAGYYSGAQAARQGVGDSLTYGSKLMTGGESVYDDAAKLAMRKYSGKGVGAVGTKILGSGATSLGLRAAGPIGTALLVKDLAYGAGRLVGRSIKLGVESVKSAQGDLTKTGLGLGYQDNSVAATSRQRGVMAISNSRLNARSALGQEAAFMYQNFG